MRANVCNRRIKGFAITENYLKKYFQKLKKKIKNLQGDPHYIALGMAAGVFVAATPTFPFQTFFAIGLAFILRASKAAAAIGSLFSNPLTIPFIYWGSYKIGYICLKDIHTFDIKKISIAETLNYGTDIAAAMFAGGAILGIIPAVIAYFVTKKAFIKIKSIKK